MSNSVRNDPSRLKSLQPAHPFELSARLKRQSHRLDGSRLMLTKTPGKMPESAREYVPGDPIRLIDWKVFARTDQLIIREHHREAESRVIIAVDVASTMRWPDWSVPVEIQNGVPQKIEVALRVALHLAHLHLKVQDTVYVVLTQDAAFQQSKAFRPKSILQILQLYENLVAGRFDLNLAMEMASTLDVIPSANTLYWISDALENSDFQPALSKGRNVAFFHILSSLETNTSWMSFDAAFFDECGKRTEYSGRALHQREFYLRSVQDWLSQTKQTAETCGCAYALISDETTIAKFHAHLGGFQSGESDRPS